MQEGHVGAEGSDMDLHKSLERRFGRSAQTVATIQAHLSDHPGRQDLRGSHELEAR